MKSFKQALEKRVATKTKTDKHTVMFAVKQVISEVFGLAGSENVRISDWTNGILFLVCPKSVWRTEVILRKRDITKQVNTKCQGEIVKDIKIRSYLW